MANSQLEGILCQLRRAAMPHGGELTDGQLLERFLAEREPLAFEALLHRHGPMVLATCRRILRQEQDAEDAFQATFLVLVRKADSVNDRSSVGNWLYGVACRTARKALSAALQRRAKEIRAVPPESLPEPDSSQRELRALIDQELNGLPNKYREPLILCDLEGQSRREVASQLGCPEGTVSGRLARARAMLAKRLTRRGLVLSAGAQALAPALTEASISPSLFSSLAKAAAAFAAGHTVAGAVSAPVASLTQGVLHAMFMNKFKRLFAVVLVLGIVSAGWSVYQLDAAPLDKKPNNAPPSDKAPESASAKETLSFPKGPSPGQVYASIDKDGKLLIKTYIAFIPVKPGAPGQPPVIGGGVGAGGGGILGGGFGALGGGGMGGGGALNGFGWKVHPATYDLKDVEVYDTKGALIARSELPKLLKDETLAMALFGVKLDPLHLRVLKEGTLTFVLPVAKGAGILQPAPGKAGGFGFGGGNPR